MRLHVAGSGLTSNKHVAAEPPETLGDRFRDAIAPRTLVLGLGVLAPPILVLVAWVAAGVLATLAASAVMHRVKQACA